MMPAMIHYLVTEVREVNVTTNSPVDAMRLAEAAFEHGQDVNGRIAPGKGPEGIWGNTDTKIRTVEMQVKDKTYGH